MIASDEVEAYKLWIEREPEYKKINLGKRNFFLDLGKELVMNP